MGYSNSAFQQVSISAKSKNACVMGGGRIFYPANSV
jgi:hypothetical protein